MREPKLAEKRWNHEKEAEIFKRWQSLKLYSKPSVKGRIFIIDTPPPYPSGKWHMGGAIHYSQIDMIARWLRLKGMPVWFPLGIDRNGLPIEVRVEKDYGIKAHEVPREKFLQLCKETLDKYEADILNIVRLLGISVDLSNIYRTDSREYRTLTQKTFKLLWDMGLIYEASKPVNWCPGCRTTLADAEVEYREEETPLVYIDFDIEGGGKITVATTRPELLPACRAIIVHPDDSRYKDLHGKTAVVPLFGNRVKIIPHKEANPEFGTGAVMICSYGDQTDIRLFRELQLEETIVINPDGTMNEKAGPYKGLKVKEAREKIIEDLKAAGRVKKIEIIKHKVPICWRSKDPLEFITLKELYLRQVDWKEKVRKAEREMKFYPEAFRKVLEDWIDAVSQDWPITRRRYYGTPVPVFYCPEHGPWVPEIDDYIESWKETRRCPICGKPSKGDTRVFDTWMDSSITPLFLAGFLRDKESFEKNFPVFLRPQGKDIIRTWLYYTILRSLQLTGKKPFEVVWISGHVLDDKGRKMSKSLGNVLYPEPLIKKYGADAVRFAGAAEARLGSDIRISEAKIAGARKFIQKLYSVARFVSMFEEPGKMPVKLKATDRWIIKEAVKAAKKAIEGYENFDFFIPANILRNFLWDVFAPHYLEMVKARAYAGCTSAAFTMHYVLKLLLVLLSPIIPFVTDYIWQNLYGSSVHAQKLPELIEIEEEHPTEEIMEFNSMVWARKKERGLSLKDPIAIEIPEVLKPYEEDLRRMHHIV